MNKQKILEKRRLPGRGSSQQTVPFPAFPPAPAQREGAREHPQPAGAEAGSPLP